VIWNHRGGFDKGDIEFSRFLVKAVKRERPVFIANSRIGAEFLQHVFALDADHVTVIRNVFESEHDIAEALRTRRTAAPSVFTLVHIANLWPEKDAETLFHAVSLLKLRGVQVHLHLVGYFRFKNHQESLKQLAVNLDIREYVTFHGMLARNETNSLLAQADVGLLSSRSEGMPNCIMEYMYWSLPVIATDIPGIRELMQGQNRDWLFGVADAECLCRLIQRLHGDRQLRERLGAYNRQQIGENFGPKKIFPQWKQIIET